MNKTKLTNEMAHQWKCDCLAYLEGLLVSGGLGELKTALMEKNALRPKMCDKGTFLLRPGMAVVEAFFLRKGLAALYSLDRDGNKKVFYIWDSSSIIVMYQSFRERLPNEEFYIEILEDAEIVSISSTSMDRIYALHAVAHKLTEKILSLKAERRMDQLDILLTDKNERYVMLTLKFPSFFVNGQCRLPIEICNGFIGISDSTRKRSIKKLGNKMKKNSPSAKWTFLTLMLSYF